MATRKLNTIEDLSGEYVLLFINNAMKTAVTKLGLLVFIKDIDLPAWKCVLRVPNNRVRDEIAQFDKISQYQTSVFVYIFSTHHLNCI